MKVEKLDTFEELMRFKIQLALYEGTSLLMPRMLQ